MGSVDESLSAAQCGNCGAKLHGPFCHQCGQSERSPVRELFELAGDKLQEFFSLDSKTIASVVPLYFRPGRLTQMYLQGQRVRFVKPLRLYIFLSVMMFLLLQCTGANNGAFALHVNDKQGDLQINIGDDKTPTAKAVQDRKDTTQNATGTPVAAESMPAQKAKDDEPKLMFFDDKPWDATTNPFKISWLPTLANDWLNQQAGRMKENLRILRKEPARFVPAFIHSLPTAMFVLLPAFALLLKFFYIFKRRLYAEHLIVALHSHSFIYLSVILTLLLQLLRSPGHPTLDFAIHTLKIIVLIWIPIYLFLMQKRVYQQGWFMTTIKFGSVGICYLFLLAFSVAGAAVASLAGSL
jgi:Protein of unknown function (DUF3667)